jgi:membrane peptidoglycan carboxypeptidase
MTASRPARRRQPTRPGWRRALPRSKQVLWGVLAASVAAAILVTIAYAATSIPSPSSFATAQATTLFYSDGKTVLGQIGQTTRVDVALSDVPVAVQHAVLAAEDRRFYSESGISPTGIVRALVTDLRGGEIAQGGSTITQQYVKNAFLTQQRTFSRKFKEILISVKLAHSESKQQILRDYLNTIYFGRGAYGIEAAAQAYFGTDVQDLGAAQGAVLAATISQPSVYDPDIDKQAAVARWHYVIDGMASQHWLDPTQARTMKYPKVQKPQSNSSCGRNWKRFICAAVQAELAKDGFSDQRLAAGGYDVVTTIDKTAQHAAVAAIKANGGTYQSKGVAKGREASLVSVQPGDGAIRAMYGGDEFCEHKHPDDCTDLTGVTGRLGGANYFRPPGSSFKPYTVITALKQGISLNSVYSGPSQITVDGSVIHNSEGESCGSCTLLQALAMSINTIFVPLAEQVGPENVAETAHDAGIPKSAVCCAAVPVIGIGGGDEVSPLDQAVGYATIAAQGKSAEPYLVDRVETQHGSVVYRAHPKTTDHVFPADVMADTTYAMTKVLDCSYNGTACGKALPGRPAAGKTGTNGEADGNHDAWFIGFTPQLCTAVWYGDHNRKAPVVNNFGAPLYGGDLPAATWQQMMTAALSGKPVEQFPPPVDVGTPRPLQTTAPPATTTTTTPPTPIVTKTNGTGSPLPTIAVTTPPPTTTSPSPSPTTTTASATPKGKPT